MKIATSNTVRLFTICLALLNILTGGHVDCCDPFHAFETTHPDGKQCCSKHDSQNHPDRLPVNHDDECCSDDSEHDHFCGGTQPVLTPPRVSDDDLLYKPVLDWCFSDTVTDDAVVLSVPLYNEFEHSEKYAQSLRLHALLGVLLI